ncbi:MAG: hypothetical protein WAL10_16040 [Acetobacteraceae bacterium]|jgi:hypothetical protein
MQNAKTATIIPFPVRPVPEETLSLVEDLARLMENLTAFFAAVHDFGIETNGGVIALQDAIEHARLSETAMAKSHTSEIVEPQSATDGAIGDQASDLRDPDRQSLRSCGRLLDGLAGRS